MNLPHLGDRIALVASITCIVLAVTLFSCSRLPAQELPMTTCPTPSPCKVIILSAEEQQALLGDKMILDTALQGRPLDLLGPVLYFRDKIRNAPAGTPQAQPKP